jgi:hypothetical protein
MLAWLAGRDCATTTNTADRRRAAEAGRAFSRAQAGKARANAASLVEIGNERVIGALVQRGGGAALMATDCKALAYQGAALSDTARLVTLLLRPDFLVWRFMVLVLLTRESLAVPGAP